VNQSAAPKPDALSVYYVYGTTMTSVQHFERTLATLLLLLKRTARMRELKTPAAVVRALERVASSSTHAYRIPSVRTLRKELPDDFDPELLAEIERLLPWRERLAHRYLLEKLAPEGDTLFRPETAEELMAAGVAFSAATRKLGEMVVDCVAALPQVSPIDDPDDPISSLARAVLEGTADR
jgi:hypothetical protein